MAIASSVKNADHSDALELLARIGYATKGVVYLLIGGLALMMAFGEGGGTTGSKGAIQTIGSQPFGQFLLWATAIGLGAYALWQVVRAVLDPEATGEDDDKKRIAKRIGYAASGAVHGALAVAAVQMATGSGGGGSSKKTYLAKIMEMPGGTVIVYILAAIVVGVGIYQFVKGYRAKFMERLKSGEMSSTEKTWSLRVGRAGLMARGVVFGIMGYFLYQAAASGSASQAKGVGGALSAIASESYGMILLGIMAVGLIAYALHQFFSAKYRRIEARI